MSQIILFHIFTIIATLIKLITCYNFDTDSPIIYDSPSIEEDYFGYSVALYPGNLNTAWIEISAPKGYYYANNNYDKTGAIYRCHILGPCNLRRVDSDYKKNNGSSHEWLGVAVDVNEKSGKDIICSHKWLDTENNYATPGKCFSSNQINDTYETLIPLDDRFSPTIPDNNGWYYYRQYSQAGIAVHVVESKKNPNQVLIGAPGVFNWFGTVVLYQDISANRGDTVNLEDKKIVVEPRDFYPHLSEPNTKRTFFHLMGYSVTSGYYFGSKNLYYAASAPRYAGVGKVIVFQILSDGSLGRQVPIRGKQFGEYFGASITSGDLNNDGYDDIIIGAPYYKSDTYNEGRIDVYFGSKSYIYPAPNGKSIYGQAMGGQFGNTVQFLKDVNGDGFPEVAVSAPFENDGSGVVYLYRSTSNGLDPIPSQILIGKDFRPSLKGFGVSVSKALDVDGNNFRDLAVGAYKSSQTFLFRSRPTVILKHTLSSVTNLIDIDAKGFSIKYCLTYEGSNLPSVINVKTSIIVDEHYRRAYLVDGSYTNKTMSLSSAITCIEAKILLKNNIQYDDPINVKLTQNLIEANNQNKRSPIVISNNQQQSDTFCKECLVYDKYRSTKTVSIDVAFFFNCGNDNRCVSNLEVHEDFLDLSRDGYVLGSKESINFVLRVRNKGERAFFTRLSIELPNGVTYKNIPTDCEEVKSGQIICLVANLLLQNAQKLLSLDLDMKKINLQNTNSTLLSFNVTTLTSSINLNHSSKIITLPLKMEADITIIGNSEEQSYNFNDNGHNNFLQRYQVQKFGYSSLQLVMIEIKFPTRLRHDDRTLVHYESVIGIQNNRQIDCVDDTKNVQITNGRIERQANGNDYDSFASNRIYYLNCSNQEVICTKITCMVGPFIDHTDDLNLNLQMSLNATNLVKLVGIKDIIIISSEASVIIEYPTSFKQYENRPDIVQVQSFFIMNSSGVSLVLIIVPSIVLGFLLLALITYICYKKGFFKRKKMKELQALKLNNENVNYQEMQTN